MKQLLSCLGFALLLYGCQTPSPPMADLAAEKGTPMDPVEEIAADCETLHPPLQHAEVRVFKTVGDVKLGVHIFFPDGHSPDDRRPAIVFFYGGGWAKGSPKQFQTHAKYLATRGMVGIAAEYRTKTAHGVSPAECIADVKSAMRWVRSHAGELGIDADKILAGGGSAGGHLAAATTVVPGFDEPGEDLSVSTHAAALALFNPVVETCDNRFSQRFGENARKACPLHNLTGSAPPTIIFHGTADYTVPFADVAAYKEKMDALGGRCELVPYEGRFHGFFNYSRGGGADYITTLEATDRFLESLGYLEGPPEVEPR